MNTVLTLPNTTLFGPRFAHNAISVLHGDECCLCGKRTEGGRGVKYLGYAPKADLIMRPEDVARYGDDAVLVIMGEEWCPKKRSARHASRASHAPKSRRSRHDPHVHAAGGR